MESITCTAGNVPAFNQALRDHLPESRLLIKALIERGMMDGLRDSTLAPAGQLPCGVQPQLSYAAEQRINLAHAAREGKRA